MPDELEVLREQLLRAGEIGLKLLDELKEKELDIESLRQRVKDLERQNKELQRSAVTLALQASPTKSPRFFKGAAWDAGHPNSLETQARDLRDRLDEKELENQALKRERRASLVALSLHPKGHDTAPEDHHPKRASVSYVPAKKEYGTRRGSSANPTFRSSSRSDVHHRGRRNHSASPLPPPQPSSLFHEDVYGSDAYHNPFDTPETDLVVEAEAVVSNVEKQPSEQQRTSWSYLGSASNSPPPSGGRKESVCQTLEAELRSMGLVGDNSLLVGGRRSSVERENTDDDISNRRNSQVLPPDSQSDSADNAVSSIAGGRTRPTKLSKENAISGEGCNSSIVLQPTAEVGHGNSRTSPWEKVDRKVSLIIEQLDKLQQLCGR